MYKVADPTEIANLIRQRLSDGGDMVSVLDTAKAKNVDISKVVKDMKLTGADIAKLTPQGYGADRLGRGQNLRAIGAQAKGLFEGGVTKAPKRIGSALWRGMSEGGGGWRGGAGTWMRHLPMGAKAGAMSQAIPEVRGAFKKEDVTGKGRSQTERVFRAVGSVGGGLAGNLPHSVTNRLGLVGNVIGGMGATILGSKAGSAVLGGAGKLVDKGISKARGVAAGDVTHQQFANSVNAQKRLPGSTAV
jgi:hypothetical protein